MHEDNLWRKQCKRNPPKADFSKISTIASKQSLQEYYLLWVHNGKVGINNVHIFAKVPVGSKFNYYELLQNGSGDDIIAYTSHFLDRYQERMKVVGDRKHVLMRYRKTNQMYHRIHKRGKYCVYAMRDGLALAISEEERVTFVTFVSYDMLKPSQKASFDKVRCFFGKDVQITKAARDRGYDNMSIITLFRAANFDIYDNANYLYDLFFQDKIPTDFTEDMQLGESETLYINPQFEEELKKFKV